MSVAAGVAGAAAFLAVLLCAYSPEAARTTLEYGALRVRRLVEEGCGGCVGNPAEKTAANTAKPGRVMRPPRLGGVTAPPLLSPHPVKDKDA